MRYCWPWQQGLATMAAHADGQRYDAVWDCKAADGVEMDAIHKVNTKWVEFGNESVPDGDIRSGIVTAVIGDQEGFIFVDSFASLEAWAAMQKAMKTEAGKELSAELEAHYTCSTSTLYEYTPS
jgi:hypothetical protein